MYLTQGRHYGDFAVVSAIQGHKDFKCLGQSCGSQCCHTKEARQLHQSDGDDLKEPIDDGEESGSRQGAWQLDENDEVKLSPTCRSRLQIPEDPDDDLSAKMATNFAAWTAAYQAVTTYPLGAEGGERVKAFLFTSKFVLVVTIPARNPDDGQGYDGFEDTVVNQNDQWLWSWELLYGKLLDPYSAYMAYYTSLINKAHATMFLRGDLLSHALRRRKDFMYACIDFVILQQISFETMYCACEVKDKVVGDANPVCLPSVKTKPEHPWRKGEGAVPPLGLRRPKSMMFLAGCQNSNFWVLARKYVQKPEFDRKKKKTTSIGSLTEHTEFPMFELLAKLGLKDAEATTVDARIKTLAPLLRSEYRTTEAGRVRPVSAVRAILHSLVAPYPVARVLLYSSWKAFGLIRDSVGKEPPPVEEVVALQFEAPLIYDFIDLVSDSCERTISADLGDILALIEDRAKGAFKKDGELPGEEKDELPDEEMEDGENPSRWTGRYGHKRELFYTGHGGTQSVLTSRAPTPTYEQDKNSSGAAVCNKALRQPGVHGAGMFKIHCLKCGKLICFQLMKWHESPRTFHEILWLRWGIAPTDIVYDNACNFYKFVLLRNPWFYKLSRFTIDWLHVVGHILCSLAFHPQYNPHIRGDNTQLCEQGNAKDDIATSHLYTFSQTGFLWHYRLLQYLQYKRTKADSLVIQ
jgi:hypothetical protein